MVRTRLNSKKIENFDEITKKRDFSRIWTKKSLLVILGLFGIGILIRGVYFEPEIPVTFDALSHFFYAKDISVTGSLPPNYSPANNGWPIFMSLFFKIFTFENTIHYMDLQKWLSIIISCITIFPVYALSRKFFNAKTSVVTSSIFIFEPRLIYNSLFGITEPLYILLGTISMVFFLSEKNKYIFVSFAIVAFTSLIRSEGLFLFFAMSILFFIKFRKERHLVLIKYLSVLAIFLLILLPMTFYRMDAAGFDTLFGRIVDTAVYVTQDPVQTDSRSGIPYVIKAIENFVKFLGWNLIPLFIFFVPFGIFLYFKKLDFKKLALLIFSVCLSLPALHAYGGSNLDTRYLFMFFPIFCIISGYAIEKVFNFSRKKELLVIVMTSFILIGSITFLEIREMNFELEGDYYEISKDIVKFKPVINDFYPASRYLETAEIPSNSNDLDKYFFQDRIERHSIRYNIPHDTTIIQIEDSESTKYFEMVKENSLTHLAIDLQENRPEFFKDIFEKEDIYPFLEKVYDSKDEGFDYQVKIFKINYDILEKEIEN